MQGLTSPTPRALGFGQPAEWAPHAATWTSWPFDDELWLGWLEPVRREFAELVRTIASFEPVHLNLASDEAEADARQRLAGAKVVFHRLPLDDVWFRDNGPIFVQRGSDVALVNWRFNSWGGKFQWDHDDQAPLYVARYLEAAHWDPQLVMEGGSLEPNGLGLALTTRQCLLNDNRNPGVSQARLEEALRDYLGLDQLIWLEEGLEGDHTDGHIDTITRFCDEQTLVSCVSLDPQDANHAPMQHNLEQLRQHPALAGMRIVELPLPREPLYLGEQRLACTYANFYIGNGFVVVPQYHDPHDELALEILRPLFPGRAVIGLSSRALITGGGSFHCVTQQQPQGHLWKGV